ncbi:mannose 6-phosphate receptor domain-containing protein [Venturia nashicola]|uniref:Mannose 6-phosphate receptor domain-containing protein n=1 Tax=Venturia nashicola TaxID=86259 RepID=A0A4Z1PPE9_9PEZI|nr:mannose 6-phosphate receptor domain-containing protein [Venturia nashicola]
MKLFFQSAFALILPLLSSAASSTDDKKSKEPALKPCTIRSPASGAFFDLSSLSLHPPKDTKDVKKGEASESYHVKGQDFGANFTLNFCAPVVEDLTDVEGVDKKLARNVSAFYTIGKKTYSIGQQNSELVLRGSKLMLNYTNGSPCDSPSPKAKRQLAHGVQDLRSAKIIDDDDDDKSHKKSSKDKEIRRKNTIILLSCQKDPLGPKSPKATTSFAGEMDCTYIFETKSQAACAGIETTPQQLGPGGVFGVIMLIAILVYIVGGCVYQRTVQHQRGWRQLPNYSMWAGIWSFLADAFIILTSSCARFLPGRRGYSRVSLDGNSNIRGRHAEDENRLIDNLDEEWDD